VGELTFYKHLINTLCEIRSMRPGQPLLDQQPISRCVCVWVGVGVGVWGWVQVWVCFCVGAACRIWIGV
jgi:hypothetical protein